MAAHRLTEPELRVWRTYIEASKLLIRQMEKDLRPFGLTMRDYNILVILSESENARMRMSEMAAATLHSKSRITQQMKRLMKAKLVRRENCLSDRRGRFAVLTNHGRNTLREVAPHLVASARRHFIDLLSPQDLAEFIGVLGPVVRRARADSAQPHGGRVQRTPSGVSNTESPC